MPFTTTIYPSIVVWLGRLSGLLAAYPYRRASSRPLSWDRIQTPRVWACRAMSQYNLCCVVQCTLMTTDEWTSPSQGPDHTAVRCSAGTPHEVTAEYARSGHVGHHNGHFS